MNKLFTLKKKLKSNKGLTLVEAIVSILILAIVVMAVVQTIAITRQTILKNSVKEADMSQAEEILNRLIQVIPPEIDTTVTPPKFKAMKSNSELEKSSGAKYNSDENFVCTDVNDKFFTYEEDSKDGAVYGYKITVGVFGGDKKSVAIVKGYASAYSAVFEPKQT